jgi:sulfoquinovosidase
MRVVTEPNGLSVFLGENLLFRHGPDDPAIYIGRGQARFDMYRGNFDIEDYLEAREPLTHLDVHTADDSYRLAFRRHADDELQLDLRLEATQEGASLITHYAAPGINRTWWRLAAEHDERVWGCGEQMSYLDLRGRHFPLWTSEPGVGRDKSTYVTWRSDVENRAGGDYYHTNYPQPTFLSSRYYACHLETSSYADFDFRHGDFHELQVWAVPERLELFAAPSYLALVERLGARFGHQPRLPLWCEDWVGIRETSFGRRLFWDWQWNAARYPDLPARIAGAEGTGHPLPRLCEPLSRGGRPALSRGSGAKATSPSASIAMRPISSISASSMRAWSISPTPPLPHWFAEEVIGKRMLDFGLDGWMADFGEYLPTDLRCSMAIRCRSTTAGRCAGRR